MLKLRVTFSGYKIAMLFGVSSPKTICKKEMSKNAVGQAILWAVSGDISKLNTAITFSIILLTTGSPIQPNPKLANVIPNCVTER